MMARGAGRNALAVLALLLMALSCVAGPPESSSELASVRE